MEGTESPKGEPMEGPSKGMRDMYESEAIEKTPIGILNDAARFVAEGDSTSATLKQLSEAKTLLYELEKLFDTGKIVGVDERSQTLDVLTGLRTYIEKAEDLG